MGFRSAGFAALLLGLLVPPARAEVDFVKEIKPIFASRCTVCHGPIKQKAGLRLDVGPLVLKGGKDGLIVQGGKSGESLLLHALTGTNGAAQMPEDGEPLKPEQIALIKQWIDEGARTPDEPIPFGPESHWSFKPPTRPALPSVQNPAWVRNPIDAFVAAQHESRGLSPRPEAAKHTLLRRVTLDLTGLPPTREALAAFLSDTSPDAYEKVVDGLLASPRYGERWGRHWMDVWRYSDWAGYDKEVRVSQPHIWRWRDWIIESLNADKPYDRMVTEMLAADEIAPADPQALRATGFLVRNWYKFNRNTWMEDVVEHTGKAFVGMTINCAKCHDHMYDPVSQKEYYQFRAIFEPYDIRVDPVNGKLDTAADGLVRVSDANEKTETFLFVRGDERNVKKDEPLSPGVPAAFGGNLDIRKVDLPPAAYYPGLDPEVRKAVVAGMDASVAAAEKSLAQGEAEVSKAQAAFTAAAAPPPSAATTQPVAGPPFVADTFAKPRPDLWQTASGNWVYKGGKVVQTETGDAFRALRSVSQHPPDFTARLAFKTTGGVKHRSVGLSFDVTNAGDEHAVYLTASEAGPAASVFRLKNNAAVYDGAGLVKLPIALNEPYELRVDVRGMLLNVFVNDQLVLAYTLLAPRQPGRFAIWTFDAEAEFSSVRVEPLPAGVAIADRSPTAAPAIPPLDRNARLISAAGMLRVASESLEIAKLKLAAVRAERTALDARLAADAARYATPPRPDAEALKLAAGRAVRQFNVAQHEAGLRKAQHALTGAQFALKVSADANALKALTEAAAKVIETRTALEASKTALEKPSPDYEPVTKTYPATSTGRRSALAKWITSRENPLAARVAANHMWMRHFGAPLVPTVFDFGLNGKPPTNPPLLDWLAVELMDGGWSMKSLHRLMVTSAAYRMQSDITPADESHQKIDPDNIYLWHANVQRMEAESVRDGILFLAGNLDTATGGPDLDHAQGLVSTRRSMYFRHALEKQMTFLTLFDVANPNECYRRDESIIPQQALALANSSLAIAQSRRLASTFTGEVGGAADPMPAFVVAAFEQVLSRPPSGAERQACEQFLVEQAARLKDPASLTPFVAEGAAGVAPSTDPNQRARENLVLVLINHNDFVTIR